MSTVTIAQYRLMTGDSTSASATVQTYLDVAEGIVEGFLRRELASLERTETMKLWPHGKTFPKHTPITALPSGVQYEIEGTAQLKYVDADLVTTDVGRWPIEVDSDYPHDLPKATVTYTGGWTSDTVPSTIQLVVSLAAKHLLSGQSSKAGIAAASVGDVSVTYTKQQQESGAAVDALVPNGSVMLFDYRWRPL